MNFSTADMLGASILIVDDQAAHVKLLERLLRGAGSTNVASRMAPQDVPTLHHRHCHGLVLLDLQMNGKAGSP